MGKTETGRTKSSNVYLKDVLIDDVKVVPPGVLDLGVGTEIDLDTKHNRFSKTMTANTAFTFTNVVEKAFMLVLTGNFTPTFTDPAGYTIKYNENNPLYSSGLTRHYFNVFGNIIECTITKTTA